MKFSESVSNISVIFIKHSGNVIRLPGIVKKKSFQDL